MERLVFRNRRSFTILGFTTYYFSTIIFRDSMLIIPYIFSNMLIKICYFLQKVLDKKKLKFFLPAFDEDIKRQERGGNI